MYYFRTVPSVEEPSKEQFVHSFHEIESDQETHTETISSFLYTALELSLYEEIYYLIIICPFSVLD